jgi:hypothetical protein
MMRIAVDEERERRARRTSAALRFHGGMIPSTMTATSAVSRQAEKYRQTASRSRRRTELDNKHWLYLLVDCKRDTTCLSTCCKEKSAYGIGGPSPPERASTFCR